MPNSNATPEFIEQDGKIRVNQIGNKTECALLELANKLGYFYKEHRSKEEIIKIFPFSSAIKSMTTVSRINGTTYTFTKGAPDFLLPRCSHFIDKNGESKEINAQYK